MTFPKGIPFIYKFDKNFNIIKPEDESLTQNYTNGLFLESPKLLEKAMQSQKLWEKRVPGSSGEENLPSIAKRVTTMEDALLKLKEEKENWAVKEAIPDNMNGLKTKVIDAQINKSYDESFEEKVDTVVDNDAITVNWTSTLNPNDPVVVFVRHGRTPHNKLKLFTGWEDPPLAIEGVEDAREAGRLLKKHGFQFDVVYTSWLYRAIQTAWYILEEMDLLWLPLIKSWRLNERH